MHLGFATASSYGVRRTFAQECVTPPQSTAAGMEVGELLPAA